jgi:hypothetical protein
MTNDCNIRRNDEDCRCTLFEYASETFVKYLDNKLWGDVYLGVKVSDIEPSSGISNTEFFIDNNPIGTILYTTKFSNGEHTLSAKVYDKSGNIGESSITIQIKN